MNNTAEYVNEWIWMQFFDNFQMMKANIKDGYR